MAIPYLEQRKNIRKTWMLMLFFLVLIVFVGWILSVYYNNQWILYYAVAFSLFSNFFSYFYSDKIALSVNGAKPADPKNPQHLRAIRAVENMSMVALIPMPKVYIINDPNINAFATGRKPEKAAVAFTTGLLDKLEKTEIEGVAAHEIAHIKNRDILVMTVAVTLVGVFSILSDFLLRTFFLQNRSREQNNIVVILIMVAVIFISVLLAKLIQLAISRKREYLADASGAEITRHPEALASALRKISQENNVMKRANSGTAHLFISSPFGETNKNKNSIFSFYKKLFSTHPPIEKRIEVLENMNKI